MKSTHSNSKADYIGIIGSILCIIHCLLVPALAFSTTLLHSHETKGIVSLDYLFILVNGLAVYFATREHKSLSVKILLWSALLIFSISLIFEGISPAFSWLGYLGSALLIAGHLLNIYTCRIAPRFKLKVS